MATKQSYEKRIVGYMQSMGTYRTEYRLLIGILAGMLSEYDGFEQEFEESGRQITEPYTNKAGATNDRKTPVYSAMEALRKDIAVYSDRLYLNPKSLGETVETGKQGSKLAEALAKLGG